MSYSRTTWVSSETALSATNMNNIEDGIEEAMAAAADAQSVTADMLKVIGNAMYPVGAVYISYSSTSPASIFGGTWTQIKDRFLLAYGDTYTTPRTGGSATISGTTGSTTLTAAQSGLPAHTHAFTAPSVTGGAVSKGISGGGITEGIYGGLHNHDIMAESTSGTTGKYPVLVGGSSVKGDYSSTKVIREGHVHDLPDHEHNLPSHSHTVSGGSVGAVTGGAKAASSGHTHSLSSVDAMPPYITVYVWRRTGLA